MYLPTVDLASEPEWRDLVATTGFATFIAPGRDRTFPVVVPVHYVWEDPCVLVHFHRSNPVWEALAETPAAMLHVAGPYCFIPGPWNARPGTPPNQGVPTSYYAVAQLTGSVELIDSPHELAALLQQLVDRHQPEGGTDPVTDGPPHGGLLGAIRGARLTVTDVAAKAKFGGNRSAEHRAQIAHHLDARGGLHDAACAAWARGRSSG